ncbi:hypothetical protein [Renibacterium salmoninarum]|uniref:hypothetical protein n=1 Tax=Renibacterium salmoninarum TaxID=1646 RepID=UPI0011AB44DE|nr:hypothetical protein [Renibacterium salmoninarum]
MRRHQLPQELPRPAFTLAQAKELGVSRSRSTAADLEIPSRGLRIVKGSDAKLSELVQSHLAATLERSQATSRPRSSGRFPCPTGSKPERNWISVVGSPLPNRGERASTVIDYESSETKLPFAAEFGLRRRSERGAI